MALAMIVVDGREIPARTDAPLLWAALDAGIRIPNLCAIRDVAPTASCRLCFVEIEGKPEPVPSCAILPADGMVVRTDTPRVLELRRTAFDLLMAAHVRTCHGCAALGDCALIDIAKRTKMPLHSARFPTRSTGVPDDARHADIVISPDRCVLCAKCIVECARVRPGDPLLEFAYRGRRTVLSTFAGDPLPASCSDCMRCVGVCPTAGLYRKKPAGALSRPGAGGMIETWRRSRSRRGGS